MHEITVKISDEDYRVLAEQAEKNGWGDNTFSEYASFLLHYEAL